MKRRILSLMFIVVLAGSMLVACGGKKNDDSKNNKADEIETEIVEVVEGATSSENEDGSITVNTDAGEQLVIDDTATKTENADGSVTYEMANGTKVEIGSDGQATVKTETTRPVEPESQKPSQPNHSHSYAASVTKQATCSEAGVKTFTCSCGSSYTQEIAKTSHNASDWQVTKNANCKEEGVKVKKCTSCGTQMETATIPKGGHTPSDWVVTKNATCSVDGSKQKTCTVCSAVIETAAIPANGTHSYVWTQVGDSYRINKCSGCGAEDASKKAANLGNGIYGYYDDNAALELFNCVNVERNSAKTNIYDEDFNVIDTVNIPSLVWGYDSIAKQRALEIVSDFSHNGLKTDNENLAVGQSNAITVLGNWCASSGHAQSMLSIDYVYGSTACLWVDSDGRGTMYPYWVLVLSIQ